MILAKPIKPIVLPKKFSSTFVSKVFFPRDYECKRLSAINSGRCYDWAYLAYCLWPGVLLWTSDMHAWIQSGRKFFDSESIKGLKDHAELRCNSMCPGFEQTPTVMDIQSFKNFWNMHGGGRTHHWGTLHSKILSKGLTPVRS